MSFEHPYPDFAYLDVDHETREKRWFGTKGMGVGYVHEDRVAEMIFAEREACAKIAELWGDRQDQMTDTAFVPGANHGEKFAARGIADKIRNKED